MAVCGVHGASVLQAIPDDIYKQWPSGVRMFTCKGLVADRQSKPGWVIKAPMIRSMHPKLPSPADKDPFM